MENWLNIWHLKVNQSKSDTFTLRQAPYLNLSLYSTTIPSSPTVKYLGLTLDQRLNWAHHIRIKRLALNNRLRMLKTVVCNSKHVFVLMYISTDIKLLIYKSLLKLMWTYGLKLWGYAKKSNINKIQAFQNIALRKFTDAPFYVTNCSLHSDRKLNTDSEESECFYKRFHNHLNTYTNPFIKNLACATIPGNPPIRLKRKWGRDLL